MPCKFRTAKQLVSHNIHSSTYNYKYTFSVEIVPVCKVWPSSLQLTFLCTYTWLDRLSHVALVEQMCAT